MKTSKSRKIGEQDDRIEDLIDIPLFQKLQDDLNEIYAFPSAITDNDGNILTATAWQDVCTRFYRQNPESEKECIKSDKYILDHINDADPAVIYTCPHGLTDTAMPIIIGGKHLANFYTGQFFLDEPDLDFFREQAKKYGFDEESYLTAVRSAPVISKERLSLYHAFIKTFTEILIRLGQEKLYEIKSSQTIRESEERLRMAAKATGFGIYSYNFKTTESYYSQEFLDIYGIKEGQIIELDSDFVPKALYPDDKPYFLSSMQKANNPTGTGILDIEYRIIRSDNKIRWLRARGLTSFSGNKESDFAIQANGIVQDITDYRKNEEALQKSEEKFRLSFMASHDGMYIATQDEGLIVEVNDAFKNIFGYTREEVIGKTSLQLNLYANPDDRKLVLKELKTNGYVNDLELIGRKKEGEIVTVSLTIGILTLENVPHILGIIRDITASIKAKETLLRQHELVSRITETSPVGITIVNMEGQVTFANTRAEQVLGLTKDKITQLGYNAPEWQITDLEGNPFPDEKLPFQQIMTSARPVFDVQHAIQWSNGRRLLLSINAAPILDANGAVEGMIATLTDITERKLAEEELKSNHEKLKQKIIELERFNRLAVDRELRMVELKQEINELLERLGEKSKYRIVR